MVYWGSRYIKQIALGTCLFFTSHQCFSQKFDFNYLNRSTPYGSGVSIKYSELLKDISIDIINLPGTVSGSPILSDSSGEFLGYYNTRNLYDSIGRIAVNGDSLAVGYFQNYLFSNLPEHEGLGNGANCAFIPINDSLYYLFNKSSELWPEAPGFKVNFEEKGHHITSYSDGLFLTKVHVNKENHRLFILEGEKQVQISEELFQYKNLMFCKHANGKDWWLIIPKALDNKACRFLIYENGDVVQLDDILFSDNYWRVRSTTEFAFSPDGSYLARLIVRPIEGFKHIFELFNFDRCDGTISAILNDSLSLPEKYTNGAGVEFSENGRFIYLALGSLILQMDLNKNDFFNKRDTIGQWDGYLYFSFLEPIFDALWRLPNGKILVASAVSTPFLHYIKEPNLKGDSCGFEQRAIMLPEDPLNIPYGVTIEALPRFPLFRMKALESPCTINTERSLDNLATLNIYPNPANDLLHIINAQGMEFDVYSMDGRLVFNRKIVDSQYFSFSVANFNPGLYIILFHDGSKLLKINPFVKI